MKKIYLSLIAVLSVCDFTYGQFILAPNSVDSYNTNSGNVGIGTTSPAALLHLNGLLNGTSSLSFGVPGSTGNLNVPVGSSPGGYNIDFYTYRDIDRDQAANATGTRTIQKMAQKQRGKKAAKHITRNFTELTNKRHA